MVKVMPEYVTCESVAAITLHIREVTEDTPMSYSGFRTRPYSLCGAPMAWDTRIPLHGARCMACLKILGRAVASRR